MKSKKIFKGIMKKITVDDLVEYKILPFDIYDENGEIIFKAGDNLTPGKCLQLKYISKIYYDDCKIEISDKNEEYISPKKQINIETIHDDIEDENYKFENESEYLDTVVNTTSPINSQIQLQLKSFCKKAYETLNTKIDGESIKQIKTIRDILLVDVLPVISQTHKKSQIKIIGDYDKYHGLNVSLLSLMLARKLNYSDAQLADIVLAALLHDIGKTRLPKEFHTTFSLGTSVLANSMYEIHAELGYKILKNEMRLSDDICRVALEHHEKNDGTGYPFGISSDLIHKYSQIISICNMYDNLISGKAHIIVTTPQEAVKKIIELGTGWFSPEILYSFVYMTNYHDDVPLDDLLKTGVNWK